MLKKARSIRELRRYAVNFTEGDIATIMAPKQPLHHFYYVLDEGGERCGFARIDYVLGTDQAVIAVIVLDPVAQVDLDRGALLDALADRAKKLGAAVVAVDHRGDAEPLTQRGWTVEQVTYRLNRLL